MNLYTSTRLLLLAAATAVHAETYDVLIAGAGTAGLVVANRLSELANITVAVIEPGDDVRQDPGVQSIDFNFAVFNKSINWQYPAVTSPELGSRNLTYRAGKAWGGTSATNGMVYIRGDKAQYDSWEELGNPGWNWDSVYSYAKFGENFAPPLNWQTDVGLAYAQADHGESGLLDIGYSDQISNGTFYDKARATWEKLGIKSNADLNGGITEGFGGAPQMINAKTNVRADSAYAYYTPVESRTNLKIIKGTVKRITWAESSGEEAVANGFEYVSPSGELVQIGARKQVVLSASPFRNPLILEGSGVGNSRILDKLRIPTKVNLPGVGESMQDHNVVGMKYDYKSVITGRVPYATMPTARDAFGENFTSIASSTAQLIRSWAQAVSDASVGAISPRAVEARFRIQHDLIFNRNVTIAELFPGPDPTGVFAQFWTSMPFSWGRVHLGSRDAIDQPVITTGLFTTDFDMQMLAAVGKLNQKAYTTAPLSDLIGDNTVPGYDVLPLDATDEQWASYLKSNVLNALHVTGACPMLPRELGGVVDPQVKVYGTQNVRIVDASIIPMPLTGHTCAPIFGVAEKASALIKADLIQ